MQLRGINADDISCFGCELDSIDLRQANIHRALRWREIIGPEETTLDLRNAIIGAIEDDEASWPSFGHFHTEGLVYGGFTNCSTDIGLRLQWIERDLSKSPRAYKQLASVYSNAGETRNSREVLYHLEELLHRKQADSVTARLSKLPRAAWSQLLKWTIGYGYKLERAFIWMLVLTVLGFVCSFFGYRERVIVPTDKDAYAYFEAHGQPPSSYQRFSSLMYSIEHSVPAINLGVSASWSSNPATLPSDRARYFYKLRWWFWGQTLLGWGLSIFFIAGLTGLVKSDK